MREQPALDSERKAVDRRHFMGLALASSLAVTLGGILAPIVGYLWPPALKAGQGEERVLAGTLAEFPPNTGKVVSVNNRPVIMVNTEKGGIKAFSAVCTHLACIVYWHGGRGVIQCPCHDGRFSPLNGQVILGPPPAPLAEYEVQIDGDVIYVRA